MTLHCGGRLGTLSYLYQHRHSIAYSLGFTAEKVIAMCSSDYDYNRPIIIEYQDTDQSIPVGIFQARDINLFIESLSNELNPRFVLLREFRLPQLVVHWKTQPVDDIFHPPATV